MTASEKTVTSASGALTLTMGLDVDLWSMTDRDRSLLEDVLYLAACIPVLVSPDFSPGAAVPEEDDVERDYGTDLFPCSCRTPYATSTEVVACHVRGHTLPGAHEDAPALNDEGIASGRLAAPISRSALADDGIESGRLPLPRPVYNPVTRLWSCHCGVDYSRMRGVLGCCSRDHVPLPAPEPGKLYACDEPGCDRVLATSQALGGHKVSAHGSAHNKQECPHCHGMFDSRGYATHVAAEERALAVDRRRAEGEARLAALAAETRARLAVEEATASVALDGETQVVGVPDEPEPGPQLSVMIDADSAPDDVRAGAPAEEPIEVPVIPRQPDPEPEPDLPPAAVDMPPLAPLSVDAKVNAGLRAMDAISRTPSRRTWEMLIELTRASAPVDVAYGWSTPDAGRFRRELGIENGQRLDEWATEFASAANGRAAA